MYINVIYGLISDKNWPDLPKIPHQIAVFERFLGDWIESKGDYRFRFAESQALLPYGNAAL